MWYIPIRSVNKPKLSRSKELIRRSPRYAGRYFHDWQKQKDPIQRTSLANNKSSTTKARQINTT